MKHSPGKKFHMILILLFCTSLLFAEDFIYSIHVDKTAPYVKEPLILTLDINQTNHDMVLFFKFNIKPSNAFSVQPLDVKENDTYHDTKIHYSYLIYPLKAGKVPLEFTLVKKVTNDESVAYSYSGGRDNVKTLVTKNTDISIPPIVLEVQSLPKETKVVGDFKIKEKISTHRAKTYEPIPFQISISGEGYPPLLKNILPPDLNITLFKEKPIITTRHHLRGSSSTVTYPMALSHNKSFTLPAIVIQAFDPKKKESYTLTVPKQEFNISQEDTSLLLDKEDNPKAYSTDWGWLKTLASYLIVFAAGYLTAVSLKWRKRIAVNHKNPLTEKIRESKDAKSLLQILIAADSKKFSPIIERLEKGLYKNAKINFKRLQQQAIEEST